MSASHPRDAFHAAAGEPNVRQRLSLRMSSYLSGFARMRPSEVVAQIRAGRDVPTQAVVNLADGNYRRKLVRAGLIDALLGFLAESSNGSFEDARGGGDLAFPHVWTNALMNAVNAGNLPDPDLENSRMEIARRIGPLVKCMTDLERRECFGSRDYWLQNAMFFTGLLSNLVLSPSAVPVLVKHGDDSVRRYLVQSLFYDLYRADIKEELAETERKSLTLPDAIGNIQNLAASALIEFVDVPRISSMPESSMPPFTKEGARTLAHIGSLPVVSPEYKDAPATVRGMALSSELLDVALKASEKCIERSGFECLLWTFRQLHEGMDPRCFGNDEICAAKLVKIGRERALAPFNQKVASVIIRTMDAFLLRPLPDSTSGEAMPDDRRFSAAINEGLLDVICEMLDGSSRIPSSSVEVTDLLKHIESILKAVGTIALHRKTNKAILERADEIREKVDLIGICMGGNATSIIKSAGLIEAVLDKAKNAKEHETCCRRCMVIITGKVKVCAKCLRATYCSRECQVKDWKEGGHKQACKSMRTMECLALKRGASKRQVKNAKKEEENLSQRSSHFFFEQRNNAMLLAILRGLLITECVVELNFCDTPPTLDVIPTSEYLKLFERNSKPTSEQFSHTKGILERNCQDGALTLSCPSYSQDGACQSLLKTVPVQAAGGVRATETEAERTFSSWAECQHALEKMLPFKDELEKDPEMRNHLIEQCKNPGSAVGGISDFRPFLPNGD